MTGIPNYNPLLQVDNKETPEVNVTSQATAAKMHMLKMARADQAPKSGIEQIDQYIKAFLPGSLTVLGAETSAGKSTLCANIAANIAVHQNKRVLFFALESGASLSMIVRCHINQKSEKDLTQEEQLEDIPNLKFVIPNGETVDLKVVERLIYEENPSFVIIDHIHYMVNPGEKNMSSHIGGIVRSVGALARKYQTHILLVSHLNKPSQNQDESIPKMSRLRDSSFLYQDPAIVMLLARKRKNADDLQPGEEGFEQEGVVYIAKNRDFGPTGVAKFIYYPEFHSFRFTDL